MQNAGAGRAKKTSTMKHNVARRVRYVALRTVPGRILRACCTRDGLLEEIEKLPIGKAGVEDDGTPFLELLGGIKVFGYPSNPADRFFHNRLRRPTRRVLPLACYRLAVDIVCRYVYPQALGTMTPPYPLRFRKRFHPQHWDTIADLTQCSEEQKAETMRRFQLGPGDVVLDIGAFIGLGALRLSGLVGSDGRIISAEADEQHAQLFKRNMSVNGVENVTLVRRAIWNGPGEMPLEQEGRQANSLVSGIVESRNMIRVKTESVDNLVRDAGLDRVTLVSLTINGAEVETIEGMDRTLRDFGPSLSIAGWYERDGRPVHEYVSRQLAKYDYEVVVAPGGRVYAWCRNR